MDMQCVSFQTMQNICTNLRIYLTCSSYLGSFYDLNYDWKKCDILLR